MTSLTLARELPSPVTRLPFVNSSSIHIRERGLLAAVCYSGTGRDTRLFLIDVNALQSRKFVLPKGNMGAYGFVLGADGRLYMGTFAGRIIRFDIDSQEMTEVAHPFTAGELVWGGGASAAGRIYMGVYPTGAFCEYDIAAGTCRVHQPLQQQDGLSLYARQFVELPDGRMLIQIGGGASRLIIFDPETQSSLLLEGPGIDVGRFGTFGPFLDEERLIISDMESGLRLLNRQTLSLEEWPFPLPEGMLKFAMADGSLFGIGANSGALYRLDRDSCHQVWPGFSSGNRLMGLHHLQGGEFMGLGDNGLFIRFDIESGASRIHQVDNLSDDGMGVQMLEKMPGSDLVAGSHFINMQTFLMDLRTEAYMPSLHKISSHGGQINCGTWMDGLLYLGSYGKAVMHLYDPQQPFVFGKNPRVLFESGQEQNRPVSMVNDGKLIYMCSKAAYGKIGGSIVVFDPTTGEHWVYRHFVPDQNPTSLFICADAGLLVGTTQTFGDMKTAASPAEAAVVFLWDTAARSCIYQASPWETEYLTATALSPGGLLAGFESQRRYTFDVRTREMRGMVWEGGSVRAGFFLDEQRFLGATDKHIFIMEIDGEKPNILMETEGTSIMRRISENEILINYGNSGLRILRLE